MQTKIKVRDINRKDLEQLKQKQLSKIKAFVKLCPFATLVYIALETKIPMGFIIDNKTEIESYFPKPKKNKA